MMFCIGNSKSVPPKPFGARAGSGACWILSKKRYLILKTVSRKKGGGKGMGGRTNWKGRDSKGRRKNPRG